MLSLRSALHACWGIASLSPKHGALTPTPPISPAMADFACDRQADLLYHYASGALMNIYDHMPRKDPNAQTTIEKARCAPAVLM